MKTIRQLREEHRFTQEQIARQLGCSTKVLTNWERGRSEPKARHLRTLARIFGVPMDDIAFEAEIARRTWTDE